MPKPKFDVNQIKSVLLNQQGSLHKEEVDLTKELGIKIYVREISGYGLLEYDNFVSSLPEGELSLKHSLQVMARLVALTACDEHGNLLFSVEEADKLIEGSQPVLRKIHAKSSEVCGLRRKSDEQVAANLKNVENSPST